MARSPTRTSSITALLRRELNHVLRRASLGAAAFALLCCALLVVLNLTGALKSLWIPVYWTAILGALTLGA